MNARIEDMPLWARRLALKMHEMSGVERTPAQLEGYAAYIALNRGIDGARQRAVNVLRNSTQCEVCYGLTLRDCVAQGEQGWQMQPFVYTNREA